MHYCTNTSKHSRFEKKSLKLIWFVTHSVHKSATLCFPYADSCVMGRHMGIIQDQKRKIIWYLNTTVTVSHPTWDYIYKSQKSTTMLEWCESIWSTRWPPITVFKNKLLTKVDAPKNGLAHENHCIKRPSQLRWFRSISLDFFP